MRMSSQIWESSKRDRTMKTLLLGTVLASLALLTSCSNSSSNGDGSNSEAPLTLEGKTLTGGMYVDTLQIESNWVGFHLNLTFNGSNVAAEGTMKENMGKELPAKGTFDKR